MLCCTMHRENVGEQREKEGVLRLSESGTCMVVRRQATVGCLIRIVRLSADGRALGSNPKFDKFGRVRGRSLIHTNYIKIIVQTPRTRAKNTKPISGYRTCLTPPNLHLETTRDVSPPSSTLSRGRLQSLFGLEPDRQGPGRVRLHRIRADSRRTRLRY